MTVEGKPHPHSFLRDGTDTRTVELVARRGQGISIKSGIDGLLVLKSTGSAFYGFHRDEYTRLPETYDRILSTEVVNAWQWKQFSGVDQVRKEADKFNKAYEDARRITIETFAKENSPSVQATMYHMCEQILAAAPDTAEVEYTLPNKHYFEIGEYDSSSVSDHMTDINRLRSELVQGLEKHWQGRRSVRSSIRSEWPHPLQGRSQGRQVQALEDTLVRNFVATQAN